MSRIKAKKVAKAKNRSQRANVLPCQIARSVFFYSLGCPRNRVDTEYMIGLLQKEGLSVARAPEEADFIVINTCGFLEAARRESLETIKEAIRLAHPSARVIVTGCMVRNHGDLIKKECPSVHYLLGSGDLPSILRAVRDQEAGCIISEEKSFLGGSAAPRTLSTPPHYAFLKIAEGCRKRCSFCIIPEIKGSLRSKPKDEILSELKRLLDSGVKEVILIAQDLGDWGKDLESGERLADLLKAILRAEPRDFWLRLLYLYPDEIDSPLIDVIASDRRICHYLDMPIQHAADSVLRRMGRRTSKQQIIDTVTQIRTRIPDMVLRTSLIVGFPGETHEEFEELRAFLCDYPFEQVGFFSYSQEAGSYAAGLPDQIDTKTKEKRIAKLVRQQQKACEHYLRSFLGKELDVMVDGFHPDSHLLLRGHFSGQCPEIDGQIIINDFAKVEKFGMLYRVKITDFAGYDLIGSV
jgi:ribosomal protein S12 methylthiotransferase